MSLKRFFLVCGLIVLIGGLSPAAESSRDVPDGDYAILETREAPTLEARRVESSPRPPA